MSEQTRSVFSVLIRAPIEKVWEELTKTDSVLPFFFNCACKTPGLEVGAPIRMRSGNEKYTAVVGDVLEYDPPRRYAHTFKFTAYDDPLCKVIYDLVAVEDGTEFTITSEQIPVGTKTEKYMVSGMEFIANNFKAIVETGKATGGGRFALFMMGLMAPFTPKSSLSENWPFDRKID